MISCLQNGGALRGVERLPLPQHERLPVPDAHRLRRVHRAPLERHVAGNAPVPRPTKDCCRRTEGESKEDILV
jgi:hypothetical protein